MYSIARIAVVLAVASVLTIGVVLEFRSISLPSPTTGIEPTKSASDTTLKSYSVCPSKIDLTCTEWIIDAFDSIIIPQSSIISKGANATEIKLCEYNNPKVPTIVRSAGIDLPSGVALIKCNNALIKFGSKWGQGVITCGTQPLNEMDSNNVHENTDVLFATAMKFPNIMQHNIQNGLDAASVMWDFVKDDPNVHILTGESLKAFYTQLVGSHRIHINTVQGSQHFFRCVYLGFVPTELPFGHQNELPTKVLEIADRIKYDGDRGSAMLPCSVQSMPGFKEWRSNFTRLSDNPQKAKGSKTLLYLQRVHTSKRPQVFWDCGKDTKKQAWNGTCSCQSVSENEFIKRLGDLSRRHGLEMKVFQHTTMQQDAETFARAKIVVGPHGGAFANIIYLDPELNPLMIETNLQQTIYDCCNDIYNFAEPRHFFPHLAASLGHRYRSYQPHVWRNYGMRSYISLEVNDYLEYIDKSIRGPGTDDGTEIQLSAIEHPCVSQMGAA